LQRRKKTPHLFRDAGFFSFNRSKISDPLWLALLGQRHQQPVLQALRPVRELELVPGQRRVLSGLLVSSRPGCRQRSPWRRSMPMR
jgi:hypothetical protein